MIFLLKLVMFFFLFLFVMGFFSLIILRYKVKKFLKRNAGGAGNPGHQRAPGEVWVDDKRNPSQSSSKLKDVGDYVDYEEVKD